ncbi:MAG: cyclodeaminase/cyclohydrolase family protein [Phycisphaerales bacterium]
MEIRTTTIGGFLDLLAAAEPTPGGGGAAGLIGATGAALGAMVVRYAEGKPRYAAHAAAHAAAVRALDGHRGALLDLADRDAVAYRDLSAAMALDKGDPGRGEAVSRAARAAIAVPLELMERCAGVAEVLASVRGSTSRWLASDLSIAVNSAVTACRAARLLVLANADSLGDDSARDEALSRAEALLERASAAMASFEDGG